MSNNVSYNKIPGVLYDKVIKYINEFEGTIIETKFFERATWRAYQVFIDAPDRIAIIGFQTTESDEEAFNDPTRLHVTEIYKDDIKVFTDKGII
ncbi:hypothetical protein [Metabacillus fastidiosus]|uniref:Uncharacterized protein n=1 Tax=Metabacillus fastidiosus TaxID=1458 RepID=A0ABU6NRP7_9BACI|nr:hypothetical protein [Metabacillus fastidiosus]